MKLPQRYNILKLKLMLAIVSAVLCVRSSFALGSACFTDISNVDAQVSFATYYDNYDFLGKNGVPQVSGSSPAIFGNATGMATGKLLWIFTISDRE